MLLCIDTSGSQLVLALWDMEKKTLRGELLLDTPATHGQTLMPAVEFIMAQTPGQLRGLGVCVGPGSFTGLRVGLATAQGLAFSLNLPVVQLSSLELLAAGQGPLERPLWALMDARQKMLYAAPFIWREGRLCRLGRDGAASLPRLLELLEGPAYLLGSGAQVYAAELERPGIEVLASPTPRGEVLARLAAGAWQRGEQIRAEDLRANYCRPSDAEARFGRPLEAYNLL